jgi:branched-chain amino acid transport system permease protein
MSRAAARIALMLAAFVVIGLLPLAGNPYLLDLGIRAGAAIVLAVSWNICASAGLISLGHAAFWGVGAYAGALTMAASHSVVAGVLAGAGASLGVGLFFGILSARMRRFYFAIATLAYAEAFRVAAITFPAITGGSVGLFIPSAVLPAQLSVFYGTILVAAIATAVAAFVADHRSGYAFTAMRDNEPTAMMIGIRPFRYRLLALALAATPVGAVATLSVAYTAFLDPNIAFSVAISVEAQIAAIAGGMYTVSGPVMGAIIVTILSEVARQVMGAHSATSLVFGSMLVLLILFCPSGVIGILRRLRVWCSLQRRYVARTATD